MYMPCLAHGLVGVAAVAAVRDSFLVEAQTEPPSYQAVTRHYTDAFGTPLEGSQG